MGNPAGVRHDFDAWEKRRMKAAKLLKQGLSESEVARRAGVHRQSVNRWSRQMAESGKSGLNKAGRKPRLSRADLKKIESGLKHGPEALGYDTPLWTAWRVAQLIEEECGVRFHPGHVWRILRQLSIIQFCSPLYIPISKREFIGRSKTAPDRLTSDQPTSHGQLVRISWGADSRCQKLLQSISVQFPSSSFNEAADRRRASLGGCGSRSAWTASRCPPVTPQSATA